MCGLIAGSGAEAVRPTLGGTCLADLLQVESVFGELVQLPGVSLVRRVLVLEIHTPSFASVPSSVRTRLSCAYCCRGASQHAWTQHGGDTVA
jgi:hypothetical protein